MTFLIWRFNKLKFTGIGRCNCFQKKICLRILCFQSTKVSTPLCGPFHLMEPIMQNIKISQIISKQCFEFTKPPAPYQQQLPHCCSVSILLRMVMMTCWVVKAKKNSSLKQLIAQLPRRRRKKHLASFLLLPRKDLDLLYSF